MPRTETRTSGSEETREAGEEPAASVRPPRRSTSLRRNSVFAHPALNFGALAGCAASAIVVGFLAMLLREAGVQAQLAILLAVIPAAVAGWFVVDLLVVRQVHRTQQRIEQLRRQLRLYASVSTRDLFERILLKTDDDLGRLSRDIHAALTAAHQDRLHSARLQRDFSHRLQRETRRATHHLTRLSLTDELTGLGNRRAFEDELAARFAEAKRVGQDLTCVSFDLDRFKQLNDTHGHAAGDAVLAAFAEVLAGSIRQTDFAARLGGDEFVLLLPRCDETNAGRLCERLSLLFGQHPDVARFGTDRPTASYGAASLLARQAATAEDLLAASDEVMYAAKQTRRSAQAA